MFVCKKGENEIECIEVAEPSGKFRFVVFTRENGIGGGSSVNAWQPGVGGRYPEYKNAFNINLLCDFGV